MAEHPSADQFFDESAPSGRSKADILREVENIMHEYANEPDEAKKADLKTQADALKKEYREADSSGEAHQNLEMVAQALVKETALPVPSTPEPVVEEPLSEKPAPIPDSSRQKMLKEIRPKYKPAPMPPKPDPSTVKTPAIHMTPEQGIVAPSVPEAAPLYERAKEWIDARSQALEEAAGKHKGTLLAIGAALTIGSGVALLSRSDTPPYIEKHPQKKEEKTPAKKIEVPMPPPKPESAPAPAPVAAAPDAKLAEVKAKLAEHAGNFPAPAHTVAPAVPPLDKLNKIKERPPLPPNAEPMAANKAVPIPEAPQNKVESSVNHIGLIIDRSQGHIFEDSGGNIYAFGDDFEKRLAAANAYVSVHHEAIVYVQAAEPTDSKPWVFEVVYKSGIFGGAPASILPLKGVPDAHQFGLINPESFTRQLDAPQ